MTRTHIRLPLLLLMSALAFSACSGGDKDIEAAAKAEAVDPAPRKTSSGDKGAQTKSTEAKNDKAKPATKKIKKSKQGAANIAGLTLNMTVDQVNRTAKKKGFKPKKVPVGKGPSFEQVVENSKSGSLNLKDFETIHKLFFEKEASSESLTVEFLPFEKGPRAAEITYATKATNMTDQLFLERAKEKYGEPKRSGRSPIWEFDEGEEHATNVKLRRRSLTLSSRSLMLTLNEQVKDHIEDEVNKKPAKTTF